MGFYDLYRKRIQSDVEAKDYKRQTVIDDMIYNFSDPLSYFEITKNDSFDIYGALLIDDDSNKKGIPDKKIIIKPPDTLSIGEIINVPKWGDENWIVTIINPPNSFYSSGLIEKTNNTLLYYKNNLLTPENLVSTPCIVSNKVGNLSENTFMALSENKIKVIIQNNSDTTQIPMQQKIIFNNKYAYEITSIDELSQPGLITLTMTECKALPEEYTQGYILNI